MTHVFRAMKAEGILPILGSSRRTLGAKTGQPPDGDIPVGATGRVDPRTGGMSVAPDDPVNLPRHRRPPSLGGEGRDPVFRYAVQRIPATLTLRREQHDHAVVEPCDVSFFSEYQETIHGTRNDWEVHHV